MRGGKATDTNSENRIKAAGYIRVLSDESGGNAERQTERIANFAAAHDMEIVRFYTDDSADSTDTGEYVCEQFEMMLNEIEGGSADFQMVIVQDRSRWGVSPNGDDDGPGVYIHIRRNWGAEYDSLVNGTFACLMFQRVNAEDKANTFKFNLSFNTSGGYTIQELATSDTSHILANMSGTYSVLDGLITLDGQSTPQLAITDDGYLIVGYAYETALSYCLKQSTAFSESVISTNTYGSVTMDSWGSDPASAPAEQQLFTGFGYTNIEADGTAYSWEV